MTVMASGCLDLVSFPGLQGRATLEQLNECYPDLVESLRTHPGIGFMLIPCALETALARCRCGAT
jgi:hypothetical protein